MNLRVLIVTGALSAMVAVCLFVSSLARGFPHSRGLHRQRKVECLEVSISLFSGEAFVLGFLASAPSGARQ